MTATAIEVDMAFEDETLDQATKRIAEAHGIEVTVAQESGPAAGWPVVRLAGERPAVRQALVDEWGMDDAELHELFAL